MDVNDRSYVIFMNDLTPVTDGAGKEVHLCDETEFTKITLVDSKRYKCRCALRVCKGENAGAVYQKISGITNKNIVKVYDVVFYNGNTYVLEEYLEGGSTLQKIIDERGLFTTRETYNIITEVCNGLNALHKQKPPVMHGDIKPSNIWRRVDGSIKLFDFDISRVKKKKADTNTKHAYTNGFAPPEQVSNTQQTTPRSDIYNIGVTMHYMLSGHLIEGKRLKSKSVLNGVIKKSIMPDINKRYHSVNQLKRAMGFAINGYKIILPCIAVLLVALVLLVAMTKKDYDVKDNIQLPVQNSIHETEGAQNQEKVPQNTENMAYSTETVTTANHVMSVSYKSDSGIIKLINMSAGKYAIMEKTENGIKLILSDGRTAIFDKFEEEYKKQDAFFNYHKNELYIFSYNSVQLKVFRVESDLTLTEIGYLETQMFVDRYDPDYSRDATHFFSNGYIYFQPAYNADLIDGENWCSVGQIEELYYHSNVALGDRLFYYSGNGLIEYNYSGQEVQKISIPGLIKVCADNKKIYCLCSEDGISYIKSYDGESVNTEYTFSTFDSQTIGKPAGICVTDNEILIHDGQVVKEYKR